MVRFEDDEFPLPTLRGEVDTLFRQALGPLSRRGIAVDVWNPQLDVTEEGDRFVLEIDLPGVRREDVRVELEGRTLIIAGSRKIIRQTAGPRYSHCERVSGSFRRVIPLPRKVDEERITVTLEEGILRLDLPKKGAQL